MEATTKFPTHISKLQATVGGNLRQSTASLASGEVVHAGVVAVVHVVA